MSIDYDKIEYTLRGAVNSEDGALLGSKFQDQIGLTQLLIKRIIGENRLRHTRACRDAPGNQRGSGFRYRCVCDFFRRIVEIRMRELDERQESQV